MSDRLLRKFPAYTKSGSTMFEQALNLIVSKASDDMQSAWNVLSVFLSRKSDDTCTTYGDSLTVLVGGNCVLAGIKLELMQKINDNFGIKPFIYADIELLYSYNKTNEMQYLHTYLLTYLLHGAESFLRS